MSFRDIDNQSYRYGQGRRPVSAPPEPRMRFRQDRTVPIGPVGISGSTVYPRPTRRMARRIIRRFGVGFFYTMIGVGGALFAVAAGVAVFLLMH